VTDRRTDRQTEMVKPYRVLRARDADALNNVVYIGLYEMMILAGYATA